MSVVIGIDVGGSTTKICGFRRAGEKRELMPPMFVRAGDPITSAYGAFGRFTAENSLSLSDVEKVMMTGVGSSSLKNGIYDLTCEYVPEFNGIGLGGKYLSGIDDCIVVSMGTGTAIVHAHTHTTDYLGGTGVGGGTLMGLSRLLLQAESVEHIIELAEGGDLSSIDLRIGDMTSGRSMHAVPEDLTAANFGKVSDSASKSDVARGILNMVFETVGVCAIFAARSRGVSDIVLTGNLTTIPQAHEKFEQMSRVYGVRFLIPQNAQFATVIGASLCG